MKLKSIACILAAVLLLSGCNMSEKKPDDSQTVSSSVVTIQTSESKKAAESTQATVKSELPDNFFAESDECVTLLNNGSPTNVHTKSSPVYWDGESLYITFFDSNKCYRFGRDGSKELVTDGVWNCYSRDGTMYCEDWGGATIYPKSLAVLEGDQKKIIVENCYFEYGKSAIYFRRYDERKLYAVDYDTHEISLVTELPDEYYLRAEYYGKLWFYGPEGMYCSELDGSGMKLAFEGFSLLMSYRNGYIYFRNDDTFNRYSIKTGEIEVLNIDPLEIYAYNFTDDRCLVSGKNGLNAYNADFSEKEHILDQRNISTISVFDDMIIIGYRDENANKIFEEIDEKGNVLHKYE